MSATKMRAPTISSMLTVLDHYTLEHVRHVFTAIGSIFEEVERLFPLHHHDRVALVVEQPADGLRVKPVGLVFEAVDFNRMRRHALRLLEPLQREVQFLRAGGDDAGELARAESDAL